MHGNAYRHPQKYGILIDTKVEEPFIREDYAGKIYQIRCNKSIYVTLLWLERGESADEETQKAGMASVSHLMIDFICAWMIVNRIPGSEAWFVKMLTYNFLAFAVQLPAGIILDRLASKHNRAAGMAALNRMSVVPYRLAVGTDSYTLTITAGIGNALFHVGSGAEILETYKGRAAESGIFVSTGALGIYAGSVIPVMNEIRIFLV